MAVFQWRCAWLGLRMVRLVSRTWARLLIMHNSEPTIPNPPAIVSLTSMSQSPEPLNQLVTLSVGQMKALTMFMKLESRIHETKLDAARLRFLICQAKGAMSRMRVMSASTGTATVAGVIGKLESAMISDM